VYQETDAYGAKIGNGSWNGVVGLVSNGVEDIGVGGFTVTKERSEVVMFTDTIEYSRYDPMVKFSLCCELGKSNFLCGPLRIVNSFAVLINYFSLPFV
jgi:ABC-type amino acid transport substrate-binding protein